MTVLAFPHTKRSVLILNDCDDTRHLLTGALEAAGFRVRGRAVSDVADGIEDDDAVWSSVPDVVVYDIGRGGDDQWAALRRFTELSGIGAVPLVITTTNVVRVEGQRDAVYVRSPMQFVLAYDLDDLVGRVGAAIGLAPISTSFPDSAPS